jgi:kynureninase
VNHKKGNLMSETQWQTDHEFAKSMDQKDPLSSAAELFEMPKNAKGEPLRYFAGHSLGPMPKKAKAYVNEVLEDWSRLGVEGHFEAKHAWLPYHEYLTQSFASLVGAKESEVVAMNTLTVNLHHLLISFYRPRDKRYKILIEGSTFPSDKYAVDSQARLHGLDPNKAIIQLKNDQGMNCSFDSLKEQIDEHAEDLAVIMLGNCNYLSGQYFPCKELTEYAHAKGIVVGFNFAHGAGNIALKLHDWGVDFAVWCSYKYLNSGPGSLAGAFIHERHLGQKDLPRLEGWWGHNKETRFKMGPEFDPIPTAEAWQLSNPPILPLAAMRSSLEIFDQFGMETIAAKGQKLSDYLAYLINEKCNGKIKVETPLASKGTMLCLSTSADPKVLLETCREHDIVLDFREPNILRVAPAPLYTSFEAVYDLVEILKGRL